MSGALLRPSSAEKWINCPPSARFEQFQADGGETLYTQEGTLAHELAEGLIKYGQFDQRLREKIESFYGANPELDGNFETMLEHCNGFANYVLDIGGDVFSEVYLSLGNHIVKGTGDAINVVSYSGNARKLFVSDLKYGAGKKVDAYENPQLMLYGLMALNKFGDRFDEVILTVFQPRIGGFSTYNLTPASLREWELLDVQPAIELALAGKGEFATGKHCQFCSAKANCLALYKDYKEIAEQAGNFLGLQTEDIINILDKGQAVKKFIDEVNTSALRRALNGETFEGYTLSKGNGRRYYKDPQKIEEILLDEFFYNKAQISKTELKSLTEIETLVGKKQFEKTLGVYVGKTEGAPKLVKGQTADPYNPADVFDDGFEYE